MCIIFITQSLSDMKNRKITLATTLLALCAIVCPYPGLQAQIFKSKNRPQADTPSVAPAPAKKDDYKKYSEVLKDAVTDTGMFGVHRVGTDYFFEIPDSLFGRDMLIVNKVSGVPEMLNSGGINKGMVYDEKMVRFHKDTLYKRVWVVTFEPRVSSPPYDAITASVGSNYREIIHEYFPIETIGPDSSTVIKVSKVFDGSSTSLNDIFSAMEFPSSARRELSKIDSARSFPNNVVVKSTMTASTSGTYVTVDVTSNIVLLDKEPMTARFGDNRIGYFSTPHIYYNDYQQKVEEREFVNRWRLEPREEDAERYLAGELVEPRKQIVFYIDPATPPVWVPFIMQGVEEWNEAFETAGFKNAITAKEVDPETDKDFDIDDVRYSVITYVASEMSNAMGPSVVDPRSGEIIEADIIWWHNVMDLLHSWVRLQTGAVDPSVRGNTLPVDVMGNAVRFVSSHELGHSLGLMHNFGASYSVPVDSLRSKSFTDANGTASSIMDYARFNYVAQPGDGVTQFTPMIGVYDKYAIEWGYRWLGMNNPHEELPTLNAMLREHEDDPAYWYGVQASAITDPRAQNEDLGNDAVRASRYGIMNLRRMVPYITDWTFEEGQLQFEAGKFLTVIITQWQRYTGHVMANIGGVYLNDVVYGRDLDRFVPVPAAYQRQCMQFLIDEAIVSPKWLFADPVWDKVYATQSTVTGLQEFSPQYMARGTQSWLFLSLLAEGKLHRMFETEGRLGRANTYTVEEMLGDITRAVFTRPGAGTLDIYQRMSQKNYVDALIVTMTATMDYSDRSLHDAHGEDGHYCGLMTEAPEPELVDLSALLEESIRATRYYGYGPRVSETASAKRGELRSILATANARLNAGDKATRNHYYDLKLRIEDALGLL